MKLTQLLTENPFPQPRIPERMIWTSSSVGLWRSCKRKWFWKYVMGIRPRRGDRNLAIGKSFHGALGEWYRAKRSEMELIARRYADALNTFVSEQADYYDQDELDKLITLVRTFVGMMIGYAEVYADDRHKWQIKRDCIEKQFVVKFQDFDYAGMIDLVYGPEKNLRICEHKTASVVNDVYLARLELDTQTRGYVLGAREGLGIAVKGIEYDIVKKCKLRRKSNEDQDEFNKRIADDYLSDPGKYFHREPLTFNQSELDALKWELHQVHAEFTALINHTSHPVNQLAESLGINQEVLNPRIWPINDRNCTSFFKLCEFHLLCTHGLDKGTASTYRHEPNLNEELAEEAD